MEDKELFVIDKEEIAVLDEVEKVNNLEKINNDQLIALKKECFVDTYVTS